jgi:hypothetical protein
MLNEGSLVASLAAFDEAAAVANSAPADRKAALLAWALRSRSTPLALMGRWQEAEDTIAAAMDVTGGMEEPATQVETLLLKARVLMATNRAGLAMELLDEAGRLVVAAPPWTHGWLPRYRADALLCMAPNQPNQSIDSVAMDMLAQAWSANVGFGFQRRLVLARLSDIQSRDDAGELMPQAVRRSIAATASQAHRDRWGCPFEYCTVCARAPLQTRVRHAFAYSPGASRGFWR